MHFPTISDEMELNLWKELGLPNNTIFSEFWRTMSNNENFRVKIEHTCMFKVEKYETQD